VTSLTVYEQDPIRQPGRGGSLNVNPAGMHSGRLVSMSETGWELMDPVVSGSEMVSNFWDQRWCCQDVSDVVPSIIVLSAAATERVRLTNNIAAAGILTLVIVASTVRTWEQSFSAQQRSHREETFYQSCALFMWGGSVAYASPLKRGPVQFL
jgi:hypothetical protein